MEQSEKVDGGIRGCQKGTARQTEGAPKMDDLRAAGRPPSGTTPLQGSRHASRTLPVLVVPAQQRTSKQKEPPITCCCSRSRSRTPIPKSQPQDICVPRESKKGHVSGAGVQLQRPRTATLCSVSGSPRHGQGRGEMLVTHVHLLYDSMYNVWGKSKLQPP